ncbi:hypothetical protein [Arthrobacter sp. 49Tsu3.1M3]|uniref:hypothetical protein n=1 Tax=Arthrobacter sp. 49Tsu3.1M3 TaxID=1279029 RepID=UPI0009A5C846|nr:hypothetical protein [Arthrobacter sp. 49Tsu3.1M3]
MGTRSATRASANERQGADDPPWPIGHLLRWRHRGSFLVLWADIDTIGTDTVRLREGFTAYNPALNDTGNE